MNSTPHSALIISCISAHGTAPDQLFDVLHAIQAELGYIPEQCVAQIAGAFNRSRAEIHGVISFYEDFRHTPAGERVLSICRAESCQAMGSDLLESKASEILGIGFDETSADGSTTLRATYCLGACACSPTITLDGELHVRVSPDDLEALLT